MLLAARDQLPRANARHAIIVLTDGIDSGRGTTFDAALRAALQSQTTVYVVSNTEIERAKKQAELASLLSASGSASTLQRASNRRSATWSRSTRCERAQLDAIDRGTGGRLYKPTSFNDLERTYAEVAEELRHQYALYYSPLNQKRDGGFRRVRVETTNPTHQVSARIGYFAPKVVSPNSSSSRNCSA